MRPKEKSEEEGALLGAFQICLGKLQPGQNAKLCVERYMKYRCNYTCNVASIVHKNWHMEFLFKNR